MLHFRKIMLASKAMKEDGLILLILSEGVIFCPSTGYSSLIPLKEQKKRVAISSASPHTISSSFFSEEIKDDSPWMTIETVSLMMA